MLIYVLISLTYFIQHVAAIGPQIMDGFEHDYEARLHQNNQLPGTTKT